MASASPLVSLSAIGQSINFSRKHLPSSGMETVVALASGKRHNIFVAFVRGRGGGSVAARGAFWMGAGALASTRCDGDAGASLARALRVWRQGETSDPGNYVER